MRPAWVSLIALILAGCAAADARAPEGAGASSRFFALDRVSLPECGEAGTMPARGRLPPLGELLDREGAFLLELDADFIASYYADEETVPVHVIRSPGFEDQADAVALPSPAKMWRVEDGAFVAADDEEELALALVRKDACAPRLFDRCALAQPIDIRCAQFEEIIDIVIPNALERGLGFVLPLDKDHALVSTNRFEPGVPEDLRPQRFFIADATRSQAQMIGIPDGMPYSAAYRCHADDKIWVYGPDGALASGSRNLDFTVIKGVSPDVYSSAAWLDGPHEEDPDNCVEEIYALDDSGVFQRFDGDDFTQLAGVLPELFETPHGGVVFVRPGEAIAAGARISRMLRFKDGQVGVEDFTSGADDRATAIAYIEGIGVVAGTDRGAIYVEENGAWVQHPASPLDNRPVHGIAPFPGGFIFGRSQTGGSGGSIAQYVEGYGLCESVRVTQQDVQSLHAIEDGFVVYSKDRPTHPFVGFVRTKNPYPDCEPGNAGR